MPALLYAHCSIKNNVSVILAVGKKNNQNEATLTKERSVNRCYETDETSGPHLEAVMTAYVPRTMEGSVPRTEGSLVVLEVAASASARSNENVNGVSSSNDIAAPRRTNMTDEGTVCSSKNNDGTEDSSRGNQIIKTLTENLPEDLTGPCSYRQGKDMPRYQGRTGSDKPGFVMTSASDFTREQICQQATAHLVEQRRRVIQDANCLFERQASVASQQQTMKPTVATKPLYPIGAPQRIRIPKHAMRNPNQHKKQQQQQQQQPQQHQQQQQQPQPQQHQQPQHQQHRYHYGPLNMANRPIIPVSYPLYATLSPSHYHNDAVDVSKPLDLSMKPRRQMPIDEVSSQRPRMMLDPRYVAIANAELAFMKRNLNRNGVASAITTMAMSTATSTTPTMYRPAPMMSYSKHSHHESGIGSLCHQQALHLPKGTGIPVTNNNPTSSDDRLYDTLYQTARIGHKRAAPVNVQPTPDIPVKRVAPESLGRDCSKVVPSNRVRYSALTLKSFQETGNADLLAYKRSHNYHASLLRQNTVSDSSLQFTNVSSKDVSKPIAPTRPRSKTGAGPVFHYIHHHHHHHHVPPKNEELLTQGSNGAPSRIVEHCGGVSSTTNNGIPTHEIPHHSGLHTTSSDKTATSQTIPSVLGHKAIPSGGVLIKHESLGTSTTTSPHLRRAHYRTRKCYRDLNPPALSITPGVATSCHGVPTRSSTEELSSQQHHNSVSPLRLVASSIAAGAKMNELLKPLDGPEQAAMSRHSGANNNNNKLFMNEKLARPLKVDIPDDHAFVGHLGSVYNGQANNPVPLMRQVGSAALNITRCLSNEANLSPKKANSSGNESPTMPVLTPQSVYSPFYKTTEPTPNDPSHKSSGCKDIPVTSTMFYNALTLPLYSLKKDILSNEGVVHKMSSGAGKNDSPPTLHETSLDQRVPNPVDPEVLEMKHCRLPHVERNYMQNVLHKEVDRYFLEAVDKNQEHMRFQEKFKKDSEFYQSLLNNGTHIESFPRRGKLRKNHLTQRALKVGSNRTKPRQLQKESQLIKRHKDRNIFSLYEAKTKPHIDLIDLTSSPSSSPAPETSGDTSANKKSGITGIGTKKPCSSSVLGLQLLSTIGTSNAVSISEPFDAHSVYIRNQSPEQKNTETDDKQSEIQKSIRHHSLENVKPTPIPTVLGSLSIKKESSVVFSAKNALLHSSNDEIVNSGVPTSASLLYSTHTSLLENGSHVQTYSPSHDADARLGVRNPPSSESSLFNKFGATYSPTERTFSHDPRKKILAAMNVQLPPVTTSPISPAVSLPATLEASVSPCSGRSTPSKNAARKRSLEISRLENTSSYVAGIPKRRQNVDLLTDSSLLDREERALQRAMKRFNEMEQKEKETPTSVTHADSPPLSRRRGRPVFTKHQQPGVTGSRWRRVRKFTRLHRMYQSQKDNLQTTKGRWSFSRETLHLNTNMPRKNFHDFVPTVLEARTRHSQATRSSAREKKAPYHKNARYEMEIEKEERKHLERKRQKRSVSSLSTSGDEESVISRTGRRCKQTEDISNPSKEQNVAAEINPVDDNDDNDNDDDHDEGSDNAGIKEDADEDVRQDTPIHVVIDPKNHTRMKFMTSSVYQQQFNSSAKDKCLAGDVVIRHVNKKQGGKRKFKAKHIGTTAVSMETEMQYDGIRIKKEEADPSEPSADMLPFHSVRPTRDPSPEPSPEPSPVKVVRPCPPAELKRLMVNKKLGETLLHRAARLAYNEVAIYCIDYNLVYINAKDNAGYTPLHECCVHGRLEVARHLLQHGADINASASDGTRPIHDAVDNNWMELVRVLLSYGADPLIATYSGRTTIRLARNKAMKTFIIGHLSDTNGNWELDEDDPLQRDLNLRWHLDCTSCFDEHHDAATMDIFNDIPAPATKMHSDISNGDSDCEFLLELSETPHLTTYNISLSSDNKARNWVLLSDVIKQLDTTRLDFLACYWTICRVTMTQADFAMAIKDSQLSCLPDDSTGYMMLDEMSGNYMVELLEVCSELRMLLHIEEDYI